MSLTKKAAVFLLIIAIGIFVYLQYVLVSQISAEITQSVLIEENEKEEKYNLEIKFQNPSFLFLTAGPTEFFVIIDDNIIGKGKLDSFILPSLGSSYVKGVFIINSNSDSEFPVVKISGVINYDFFFASIDVPFVYYPTQEQARKFIHQS